MLLLALIGMFIVALLTHVIANDIQDHLAAEVAMRHHEKWDGTGYPNGLRGEEIPKSARIVALADVFDALSMTQFLAIQALWSKVEHHQTSNLHPAADVFAT